MFRFVPSPRLGEQARRRRIILEQRQMRRDVFRAPQPRPFRPGQIQRADPQRTGDGAHEHHAIGRKPDRPARIERRLRARLVAFAQFLRGDSETAQDRPIIRLRAMQPADPEPRNIRRNRNAGRAPPLRQGDPRPHKNAACPRQQRARGHPRLAKDKSVHARIPKRGIWKAGDSRFRIFRQRDKAGVGQRHRPIRRSFHQRRPAQAARASLMVKMPFDVEPERTQPLSRRAAPAPSPARGSTSKTGIGEDAGTQFVPGTRAYGAHNRLHVNAPTRWRFAQSYIIGKDFCANGSRPRREPPGLFMWGGVRSPPPLSRSAPPPARGPTTKTSLGEEAHSSCPAGAHIALTIACMSTPPHHVDLRNLT